MSTLQTTATSARAEVALVERSCRAAGVPVRVLGVGPFTRRPFVFTEDVLDWVVMPAAVDPLVVSGRMAIPSRQRRHLRRLSHIQLAELLLAHEVPTGWAERVTESPRPLDPGEWDRLHNEATLPAPIGTRALTNTLGAIGEGLGKVLRGLALGAAGTVASASFAGLGAIATLDPVLIGVVAGDRTPEEGDPVGFIELVRWEW